MTARRTLAQPRSRRCHRWSRRRHPHDPLGIGAQEEAVVDRLVGGSEELDDVGLVRGVELGERSDGSGTVVPAWMQASPS